MKKTVLIAFLTSLGITAQTATDYATGFNNPIGITFNTSGDLYVAEKDGYLISKLTPALVKTTFASGLNGAPNQITFNPANNDLWIAGDGFFNRLSKVTSAGVVTENAATGSPYGVAVDNLGNVFYSEYGNGNIKKRTPTGTTTTLTSGLFNPAGMTFDGAGNLIVAMPNDSKVLKITPTGVVSDLISSLNGARFVTYNTNGDLYISTGFLNRIYKLDNGAADGSQTVFYSGVSTYGIAIYNNNLYASATGGKILKITLATLGLEENNFSNNNLVVYPNPTNAFVYIKNLDTNTKNIELFDLTGKSVKVYAPNEIKEDKLLLPNLQPGQYILKIDTSAKQIIIN
jgi:hypothetical protein